MGKETSLTRRQALQVTGAVAGYFLLRALGIADPQEVALAQTEEPSPISTDQEQPYPPYTPLSKTVKEAAAFTVADWAINVIARTLGLPITSVSKRLEWRVRNKPFELFISSVVSAPPVEEALCRLLPDVLLRLRDPSSSTRWDVGFPTSLAFAYAHNFRDDKVPGKREFIIDKFPLSAFQGGLFLWWTQRQRGFLHAVTAHATCNSTAFLINKAYSFFVPPRYDWFPPPGE